MKKIKYSFGKVNGIELPLIGQILSNVTALLIVFLGLKPGAESIYLKTQVVVTYLSIVGIAHLGLVDGLYQRLISTKDGYNVQPISLRMSIITTLTLLTVCACVMHSSFLRWQEVVALGLASLMLNFQALFNSIHNGTNEIKITFTSLVFEKLTSILLLGFVLLDFPVLDELVVYWIPISIFTGLVVTVILSRRKLSWSFTGVDYKILNDIRSGLLVMFANLLYTAPFFVSVITIAESSFSVIEKRNLALSLSLAGAVISYFIQFSIVIASRIKFEEHQPIRMPVGVESVILVVAFAISIMAVYANGKMTESLEGVVWLIAILSPVVVMEALNGITILPSLRVQGKIQKFLRANLIAFCIYLAIQIIAKFGNDEWLHIWILLGVVASSLCRFIILRLRK